MTDLKKHPPRRHGAPPYSIEEYLGWAIQSLNELQKNDSKKVSEEAYFITKYILKAWDLIPDENNNTMQA